MKPILCALTLLLCAIPTADVSARASCGVTPIKPIVPIGCDDLAARCVCDSKGNNCKWEWVCVKR